MQAGNHGSVTAVLPLKGLWQSGTLNWELVDSLTALGLDDLASLSVWSRADLVRLGLSDQTVDALKRLLARYCLTLAPDRSRRFRRPGRKLDPY